MNVQETGTIAVFGATGQQGGAVVDALLDRGARVRALVRDPESDRAQALAVRGVELAAIRIDDPASLVAALAAVAAFYFMTPEANSLEEIEAEVRVGTALVDAAVAARVPHVVFNSVFGADRETGVPHHDSKHWIEEHLRLSGLRAAMVRPTAFMENFANVMAPSLEHGEIVLRLPLPDDAPLKMVSVRDIGRVAAAILLDTADVPGGAIEVVGDELTGPQIAAAFGARAGLPARYEALPLSVLPNDLDKAMFRQFAEAAEYPSDLAVVRAIEPTARDLAEWIRSTGAVGLRASDTWSATTMVLDNSGRHLFTATDGGLLPRWNLDESQRIPAALSVSHRPQRSTAGRRARPDTARVSLAAGGPAPQGPREASLVPWASATIDAEMIWPTLKPFLTVPSAPREVIRSARSVAIRARR